MTNETETGPSDETRAVEESSTKTYTWSWWRFALGLLLSLSLVPCFYLAPRHAREILLGAAAVAALITWPRGKLGLASGILVGGAVIIAAAYVFLFITCAKVLLAPKNYKGGSVPTYQERDASTY